MDLFDEACDLPPAQQDALVARLRADEDQDLADRLAGMLASDRGPGLDLAAAPFPVHPDDSDSDSDSDSDASNDPAELLGLMSTTNPDDLPDHPNSDVIDRRRLGELAHFARRIDVRRYELLGKLGEGGMGVVLRARQRQPNRLVAIKLLRPNSGSDKLKKRFAAEGQVLARLSHKGIAKIYEAVVDLPEPYIVMELVDGRPLNEVAPDLTLPVRIALLADIADAVDHAHKNGIVHRDLKPANILVEPDNNPKVLDFGIARVVSGDTPVTTLTNVGELLGTPAFMSPEQIAGGNIGPHTDVYALGVVAYEVLTGRMPYDLEGLDVFSAFAQIRESKPIPLGKVDRHLKGDLEVIVGKALEKEPAHRYASAAAMADDFRRVLAFEPIRARPPSALYQLARFARRNRALSVAVLALFLTLVTGVIVATRFYVAAEDARHALTGRVDALLLTQSRSLLNTDPTSASATLAELSDSAPWPTAFTLAWAAKGRGISTIHPGRGAPLEWANIARDWAVLGSDDGTLRIVHRPSGRLIDTVGHDGQINRAVFLPRDPDLIPGALLASTGERSSTTSQVIKARSKPSTSTPAA
jgi:serine/threonine protein kinase